MQDRGVSKGIVIVLAIHESGYGEQLLHLVVVEGYDSTKRNR